MQPVMAATAASQKLGVFHCGFLNSDRSSVCFVAESSPLRRFSIWRAAIPRAKAGSLAAAAIRRLSDQSIISLRSRCSSCSPIGGVRDMFFVSSNV